MKIYLVITILSLFLAESCTKSKFYTQTSPKASLNNLPSNVSTDLAVTRPITSFTNTNTSTSTSTSTSSTNTGDLTINAEISANPTQVIANNTSFSTVTIKLKDQRSNPVSGMKLELASDRTGVDHIVILGSEISDSNGNIVFKVRSSLAGTANLIAKIATRPLFSAKLSIVFLSDQQQIVNAVTSPSSINKTADGSQTPITVTVKDANGAPIANKNISFSTGFWNINPATSSTDANGVSNFLISSFSPGNAILKTLVNGIELANPVSLNYAPGTTNCDSNNPEATRAEFVSSVFDPVLSFGLSFTVMFRIYKISCNPPHDRIALRRNVDSIMFDLNTIGGSITNNSYSIYSDTSTPTLLQSGSVILIQNNDLFGNVSSTYRHWSTDRPLSVDSGNNAILIKFSYSIPVRNFYDVADFASGSLVTTLRYGTAKAVKVQVPNVPKEY